MRYVVEAEESITGSCRISYESQSPDEACDKMRKHEILCHALRLGAAQGMMWESFIDSGEAAKLAKKTLKIKRVYLDN